MKQLSRHNMGIGVGRGLSTDVVKLSGDGRGQFGDSEGWLIERKKP